MTDLETRFAEIAFQLGPSEERARALQLIASELTDQGRNLGAGLASLAAHRAAWGVGPPELCPTALLQAITQLRRFLEGNPTDPWSRLLALQLLAQNCFVPLLL